MNPKDELIVVGAGGFSAEVVEAAQAAGWLFVRLYDDDTNTHGRTVMGGVCAGSVADFEMEPSANYIVAMGNNSIRHKVATRLAAAGHVPRSVVHPSAVVSRSAVIGDGSYVGAGAFIGPQAAIGAHVIVNVHASIGHDARLGEFSQVCPGGRVSGFAALGVGAFMGSNAVLSPRCLLDDWSRLGAGSFAHRSVPSRALAVGVPARVALDA